MSNSTTSLVSELTAKDDFGSLFPENLAFIGKDLTNSPLEFWLGVFAHGEQVNGDFNSANGNYQITFSKTNSTYLNSYEGIINYNLDVGALLSGYLNLIVNYTDILSPDATSQFNFTYSPNPFFMVYDFVVRG